MCAAAKKVAYSINSSAVASRDCGIVRLRAVAVLRLITNSNLVGPCTGKSAGLTRHAETGRPYRSRTTSNRRRSRKTETRIWRVAGCATPQKRFGGAAPH